MKLDGFIHALRKNGYRDTQPRRLVLEALHTMKSPASPVEIQQWIEKKHNLPLNSVTIYRITDMLIKTGLAHKHACGGGTVLCSHPDEQGLHAYLHCHDCGTSEEFCSPELSKEATAQASRRGFKHASPVLEIGGTCRSCSSR